MYLLSISLHLVHLKRENGKMKIPAWRQLSSLLNAPLTTIKEISAREISETLRLKTFIKILRILRRSRTNSWTRQLKSKNLSKSFRAQTKSFSTTNNVLQSEIWEDHQGKVKEIQAWKEKKKMGFSQMILEDLSIILKVTKLKSYYRLNKLAPETIREARRKVLRRAPISPQERRIR